MEMEKMALSIRDFCQAHGISRGTFFNLQKEGKAPKVMRVGRRTLISRESAREWRDKMTEGGFDVR